MSILKHCFYSQCFTTKSTSMENLWEKFLCYKFVTKFNNNLFNSITYVVLYTMLTVIIE